MYISVDKSVSQSVGTGPIHQLKQQNEARKGLVCHVCHMAYPSCTNRNIEDDRSNMISTFVPVSRPEHPLSVFGILQRDPRGFDCPMALTSLLKA